MNLRSAVSFGLRLGLMFLFALVVNGNFTDVAAQSFRGAIRGEITDVEQVERAVDGATIIYHLVGRLYHPSVPAELYHLTHVEGTRILFISGVVAPDEIAQLKAAGADDFLAKPFDIHELKRRVQHLLTA